MACGGAAVVFGLPQYFWHTGVLLGCITTVLSAYWGDTGARSAPVSFTKSCALRQTITISHLARTHEPRAAGRLGLVHKGGPNPSTAGSIPSLLGRTGNPQAPHEGADVAGGGMGWNGWKTESWLPTSARTAWSRIRNGSRRGMAGAGYARDMAWGAACGAGWGPFYLRARQVRWQKQLTLVELTLDTFLMCTCKGRQLSWLPGRPLP